MGTHVFEPSHSVLTSPGRLRKIDQLREKNISTYLPLPQLVAVGDQSSGKSSLLESLTGIPFPRGQELCTRYATQITHRRDDDSRIEISIIPGPNAFPTDRERLEAYHKQVETAGQLHSEFPEILDEVNTLMGIRTNKNPTGDKTFSEDILKIERCGPNEDYLTVIDVPGIFRVKTEGVTTEQDGDLVKKMVKNYIRDSRTIILAVLPCIVDIATQEILALAEKADKMGERTLGILTKPDLVTERSAKAVVCNLVQGNRRPLALGYYVVRNRGGDDDQLEDCNVHEREDMFKEDPWSSLPDDRVGISALRERLQELLGQITDKAFPELRAQTRQKLLEAQESLARLGPRRDSEREQQQYLAAVAGKFQAIVRAARDADYSTSEAFEDDKLRLVTAVINISERFNDDFQFRSHAYAFEEGVSSSDDYIRPDEDLFSLSNKGASPAPQYEPQDDESADILSENSGSEEFPDLENIVFREWTTHMPQSGIMTWIADMHRRSRGPELGTFGPRLLSHAFREQSVKWNSMTRQYMSKIVLAVHKFINKALDEVCTDSRVRNELVSCMMSELLDSYTSGMNQATFLVDIERNKRPYTLNHYFNTNLQKSRGDRIAETLRAKAHMLDTQTGNSSEERPWVMLKDVQSTVSNRSNAEHTVEDIYDILQAYYKVARKRFVDNVYHQAVDHCLLSGPNNPLGLFCEQWVLQLDTEKLNTIAGESRMVREQRNRLEKTRQDLEEAVKILR
ncbi:dynamin family protein [Dactylonectria estremocensis]|uniref:Dynamin family protein n=1 Tax=Dactylonectria estremocensis TaxID=1079267 RepID=A0A9P9IXG8_9HYPO|nr:dynamin family protein [Dactylonectria estremocensis]